MKYIESDIIELKEVLTEDLKKEIVAFANTNGGTIYIGIKDDGTIVGVDNPIKIMESISSMIHDSISPDLTMLISVTQIAEDDLDIICIKVGKGINKPYYIVAKGLKPSGVYIRSGVTSIPSSETAIRKMIVEHNVYLFESELTMQPDITFEYASKYFLKKSINFNQENQQTLGLITKDGCYTNLGLILSDQSPYVVKIAVYQDETSLQFKTRKEFQGSILKIVDDVFDYFDIINQKNSKIIGYERIDQYDYPQYALREAFLNALVHRDYSYLGPTTIDAYSNRIEIISLGGIASGLNLEDILRGISETRNPKLANVFYRLSLIEAYGTGLKRIYDSYSNYPIKPKITPTSNTFTVTLYNTNDIKSFPTEKQKILDYIKNYGSITRAEVEQLISVKKTTALILLNELIEDNLIELTDDTKRARYFIKR
jgi:ATP-dependent DNA helicase RecG